MHFFLCFPDLVFHQGSGGIQSLNRTNISVYFTLQRTGLKNIDNQLPELKKYPEKISGAPGNGRKFGTLKQLS